MAIQPVEQGSAFAFRNVINNNFYELKVLSGASKPTQSTAAVVGQMYLDTSEGKMYFCSNVSGSVYTWKPFASDMSASNVSYDNGSTGMFSDNVQDAIDELFTSASNGKELIADAITGMGVSTSANDTYATMAGNIEKIETGIDISDATLTSASELKKNIVAYSKTGQRIVGSLGQGTVNTPIVTINPINGLITASVSYKSGIINTGSTQGTKSLTTQGTSTWLPKSTNQDIIQSGTYVIGKQTILGDSNFIDSNIVKGITIWNVTGTAETIKYKSNEISSIFYDTNELSINFGSLSDFTKIFGIYLYGDSGNCYGAISVNEIEERYGTTYISSFGFIKISSIIYNLSGSDNMQISNNSISIKIMDPQMYESGSIGITESFVLYS